MVNRRGAIALSIAAGLAFSAVVSAQKNDKKQDESQKKEIQNIVKVVDAVAAGQAAPNELGLAWVREDFLKAQGNKEYVPFTVDVDASKVAGPNVALYWRVVQTGGSPAPTATTGKKDNNNKDKDKEKDKSSNYAYEDITFIPVTQGQSGPTRISRSFTVSAGTYDVFIVAKEPTSDKAPKNAPPPKTSVLKQSVAVPDFWNDELNTSSVIIAQRIDPLAAPLTPQQQADRPYALGAMEIVPAFDMKFTKKSELSTFVLIYNPKVDGQNKPDVTVEYSFFVKTPGAEPKFFNKTNPQNLNAQTLPPQFDLAQGHQLQSGQAVPLASFPEGDYRLEIKVTDKIANKSLTRDVNFSVTAG